MALIGSLMKTHMVMVGPNATVAEAARSMAQNHVGAVLVVEGDALRGILSERDVVFGIVAEGKDPTATKVTDVATTDVVSVDVAVHIRECAQLLRDRGIRHLPVTENGKPAGILSSRDFLAYVVEGLEDLVDRARYGEALGEGEDPYDHLGGSYGK
ncbi:MAG: CBS domain-containing protein [Deltaproteobacteria bacterium]|nr:CBS domain-containing protein [Deltaproteobacteria bacterium]